MKRQTVFGNMTKDHPRLTNSQQIQNIVEILHPPEI